MEDNEDEPNDVREATPVDEALLQAELDEESSSPLQEYQPQRSKIQQNTKEAPKKLQKPVKTKEECCEKKLKKLSKKSRDPKTITVLINDKECTIQRPDIIPRHCLSKKEWINLLATPQQKCPSSNLKRKVERKLRPMSQRINELAQPTRQRILSTLQDRGEILPTELVDRLVNVLEGETCLTPEQAEKLFHDKQSKKQSTRMRKEKKPKCQSDMKILKPDAYVPSVNFDKEAVTCQYLMAEAFVKSILRWNSQIPKEEFKDIADIILKRLANTLEYNLVDNADRTTQQMRFLADIIAAWIAGVLFEVAENQKDDLERACEERRRMKEEEEISDETTESEDEGFIPPKFEQLAMVEPEKEEEEDDEDGMPRDSEKGDKRDDNKKDDDDDDDAGAGATVKQEQIDGSETPDTQEAPDDDEKYYTATNSPEEAAPEGEAAPEEEVEAAPEEGVASEEEAAPEEGAAPPEETSPGDEVTPGEEAASEEEVAPQEVSATEETSPGEGAAPQEGAASEEGVPLQEEIAGGEPPIPVGESEIGITPGDGAQEAAGAVPDSAEPPSEDDGDAPPDEVAASPESLRGDEEEALIAETLPRDPTLPPTPKDSEVASKISAEISREDEDPGNALAPGELSELKEEGELGIKLDADEVEVADVTQDLEMDESVKLSREIETEEMIKRIGAKIPKARTPGEGYPDYIEENLKKMLRTDVPFLDLLKILHTIENAVANEKENVGDDLITDRIHRAIYEKFERLVRAESPEQLTKHRKDELDVLSGKIAKWIRNIMTESEILYLNDNPPLIESGELRSFGEWLGDMSDRANNWTIWMQRMINQLVDMQGTQVTRGDWKNWTRNFAADALKWRHYYLESIHHAHHNRTMLAGREVVKTGEIKYPEWSIQEKEINTTNFLQE